LALFEAERGRRLLSVDPNCRPTLTRDPDGYRLRMQRILALANIVRLSWSDLDFLLPGAPAETAVGAWLADGTDLVVLTDGENGATAWWRGGQVRVPARRVAVVDTIGAGDSFLAGLLVHLDAAGRLSHDGLRQLAAAEVEAALGHAAEVAAIA